MSTEDTISVGLISLGCAKNLVDTQVMAGVLLTDGLTLAPDPEHADVVLINTCAFVQAAREEAAAAIAEACRHKQAGNCRAVVVAGCLPQRYRARLRRHFPEVDAWLGIDQLERIAAIARRSLRSRSGLAPVNVTAAPDKLFHPRLPALTMSGGPFAYLKIAEGCNHACAFCAIPAIRGRYRSRPLADLLDEARALLAAGMREINLISQDTTFYGRERPGVPRLPTLLRALDGLEGDFWLRLLYGYPARVDGELLDTLAAARHVLPYFDLPIQHSHPAMLRAMRRADTLAIMPDLPRLLRQALPAATLRTTCLVGFPGETEEHFSHLLDYISAARFDHLGVFVFSPESGTVAAGMSGAVPAAVAEERRQRLLLRQRAIVRERNRARVGEAATALLLRPPRRRGDAWLARLPWQAPDVDGATRVAALPAAARPGDFVKVRVTAAAGYDLRARTEASAR